MNIALPSLLADSVENTPSARAADTAAPNSSATDSSTITSSDFLTLLVTEMKNQDPTAPTDPTQYVQQLVGVNSLEQLIDINQDLSGVAGTPSTQNS
jgi:flagellar basal-body rod modification protein FlgD